MRKGQERTERKERPMSGRIIGAFSLLLLLAASRTTAQDTDSTAGNLYPRYGLFGGAGYNMHSADFRALPGVPNCCPQFAGGTGIGPFGGALFESPIARQLLLSFRIGYRSFDAALAEREPVYLIINGTGSEEEIEHRVEGSIGGLTGDIALGVRLWRGLFVNVGPSFSLLLSSTYRQSEELITTSGSGTFLDANGNDSGERFRNGSEGDIPGGAATLLHGKLGLGYEIPAGGALLLVPEISYAYSFTDLADGLQWRPNVLSAGLAVKYSPPPRRPRPIVYDTLVYRDTTARLARLAAPRLQLQERTSREERIDGDTIVMRTTVRERYLLENPEPTISGAVTAFGVDANGREEPVARVRVEEFLASTAHPLLSYIFFEEGENDIPGRYAALTREQAQSFRKESLFGAGTLEVNHSVLNIIGVRMAEYPDAVLTLTGCNSDEGKEKENTGLSLRRAEGVRDYLVNTWGVAPERLKIETRDLPAVPSNPRTDDGRQENRRVEIVSSNPAVTEVFQAFDTTRITNPPTLRLKTNATATAGVESWSLKISQGNMTLKTFSGRGAPPQYVDWDLASERAAIPRVGEPLDIVLEISDPDGRRDSPITAIPTDVITVRDKQRRGAQDYRIDRFSLVLFDYNSANMTAAHQRVITLVQAALKPTSELTIEGFTDRSGSEEGNRRLSTGRAESTARGLGREDATIIGVGESRLLYTNDLPEGRFLCRTVQITVRTPVK